MLREAAAQPATKTHHLRPCPSQRWLGSQPESSQQRNPILCRSLVRAAWGCVSFCPRRMSPQVVQQPIHSVGHPDKAQLLVFYNLGSIKETVLIMLTSLLTCPEDLRCPVWMQSAKVADVLWASLQFSTISDIIQMSLCDLSLGTATELLCMTNTDAYLSMYPVPTQHLHASAT